MVIVVTIWKHWNHPQEEQEKEERLDKELLEMARKKVSEAMPLTFDLTAPLQSVTSCPIFQKI